MDICPFTNQPCPLPKIVHVTDINGENVTEHHLCQKCAGNVAHEMQPPKPKVQPQAASEPFLSLLKMVLGGMLQKQAPRRGTPTKVRACPDCGTTVDDIIKTGRFGCAKCYNYFQQEVSMILPRCQAGPRHVGKVPKRWKEEQDKLRAEKAKEQEQQRAVAEEAMDVAERIRLLKLKMAKAVEVENYEVAGVLKKKIEELQQKTT